MFEVRRNLWVLAGLMFGAIVALMLWITAEQVVELVGLLLLTY